MARSDREERERQRAHAAELASKKRRAEIRKAAAEGTIAQAAAEDLLCETRRTPSIRFEPWITRVLHCPNASSCSAELRRRFNASVSSGVHAKLASHRCTAMSRSAFFSQSSGMK